LIDNTIGRRIRALRVERPLSLTVSIIGSSDNRLILD
jgi:hypothetical protein